MQLQNLTKPVPPVSQHEENAPFIEEEIVGFLCIVTPYIVGWHSMQLQAHVANDACFVVVAVLVVVYAGTPRKR